MTKRKEDPKLQQNDFLAAAVRMGVGAEMTLRCEVCGAEQPCPKPQVLEYQRVGWPTHCDVTMLLFVTG